MFSFLLRAPEFLTVKIASVPAGKYNVICSSSIELMLGRYINPLLVDAVSLRFMISGAWGKDELLLIKLEVIFPIWLYKNENQRVNRR